MFTNKAQKEGGMKALNKKVQDSMDQEIYVTPWELDKIIRMRKCVNIYVYIKTDAYTKESLENDKYYPDVFTDYLSITKKQAKDISFDMVMDAKKYEHKQDKLIRVRISSWLNNGTFSIFF